MTFAPARSYPIEERRQANYLPGSDLLSSPSILISLISRQRRVPFPRSMSNPSIPVRTNRSGKSVCLNCCTERSAPIVRQDDLRLVSSLRFVLQKRDVVRRHTTDIVFQPSSLRNQDVGGTAIRRRNFFFLLLGLFPNFLAGVQWNGRSNTDQSSGETIETEVRSNGSEQHDQQRSSSPSANIRSSSKIAPSKNV